MNNEQELQKAIRALSEEYSDFVANRFLASDELDSEELSKKRRVLRELVYSFGLLQALKEKDDEALHLYVRTDGGGFSGGGASGGW